MALTRVAYSNYCCCFGMGFLLLFGFVFGFSLFCFFLICLLLLFFIGGGGGERFNLIIYSLCIFLLSLFFHWAITTRAMQFKKPLDWMGSGLIHYTETHFIYYSSRSQFHLKT